MKKILLSRGVVEVVIEDRRSSPRVEDSLAVQRELEALDTRMTLLQSFDEGKEFYGRVRETVSRYYFRKNKRCLMCNLLRQTTICTQTNIRSQIKRKAS